MADRQTAPRENQRARLGQTVRRAFAEFLTLPSLTIAGFLLLAVGTTLLDEAQGGWLQPLHAVIRKHFFRDSQGTSALLASIAGSIITVTSITFSLLLLAVQQAAGSLTSEVYDQFLRRRINQVYFGFFVGLALYTLIVLATVNPPYNPVFGVTVALVLTAFALMLMILLLYTTLNQMRPNVVIGSIHDHVLLARECQRGWLRKTRKSARHDTSVVARVQAAEHGYVVRVDVDALGAAVAADRPELEIVLCVSVGSFVAFEDVLAEIRGAAPADATKLAKAVQQAIHIEQQRDLGTDAAYGVEQLTIIGWTSISTAKSNPSPGLLVLHNLRDLLARWSADEAADEAEAADDAAISTLPVVYTDNVFAQLMDAFELLAVVASESMQPQTMAEIARTLAMMFERLPADQQTRADDLVRRSLSALGEHVLTAGLDQALSALALVLARAGRHETAAQLEAAQATLRRSVGKLGSRATRVS